MSQPERLDDVPLQQMRELLGKRVRDLRKERSWSQDVFAYLIGTPRSYPHKIETGKVDVQFTTLVRIAHAFGLSLTELLVGVELHIFSAE